MVFERALYIYSVADDLFNCGLSHNFTGLCKCILPLAVREKQSAKRVMRNKPWFFTQRYEIKNLTIRLIYGKHYYVVTVTIL